MRVTDTQRLLLAIISLQVAGPAFVVWCAVQFGSWRHGTDPHWRALLLALWLAFYVGAMWWVAEVRL